MMDQSLLIIIVVAIVLLAIAAWLFSRKQRTGHLQSRFGPEYERQVDEAGSRSKAEAELMEREKRVEKLSIKPLSDDQRLEFSDRWAVVQSTFVDDPARALDYADALIGEVMTARGYPVEDFERRAGDISVDHPLVVQNYRAGHEIADRHKRGDANTEDLRQAMIHYRELFEELTTE
jgi:hypothetical protein